MVGESAHKNILKAFLHFNKHFLTGFLFDFPLHFGISDLHALQKYGTRLYALQFFHGTVAEFL
jgi:hypothetical protein